MLLCFFLLPDLQVVEMPMVAEAPEVQLTDLKPLVFQSEESLGRLVVPPTGFMYT